MKGNRVPSLVLDPARESLISSSGALLLKEAIRVAGLDRGLAQALSRWRPARATHDPGKVLLDVATAVALGGDCLADVAAVRSQPEVFGSVASDPTVSRVFTALATNAEEAVTAIRQVRAQARSVVWTRRRPLAGSPSGGDGAQVIVDIDATLVAAHSDKEGAEPTFKRGFGFAPMCTFVDHGEHGTGEPLALDLRPGKASPWNSADHLTTLESALAQLPEHERGQVLVRADTGACSKVFLHHITDARLEYSIGFQAQDTVKAAIEAIPEQAWRAAVDSNGEPRDGAQVAELTSWMPAPVTQNRGITSRAEGLAARDAGHRPPRTSPPRRAAAVDRSQRVADHLLRDQHPRTGLDPAVAGGPTPTTRPLRGPDPEPEGHRPAEPALPRLRQEPSLARGRRTRRRPARLDPNPGLGRVRAGPPLGTQESSLPDPRHRRPHHPQRTSKTTPATTGLALEPAHRHRLALAAHRVTHKPIPTNKTSENRRWRRRCNTPSHTRQAATALDRAPSRHTKHRG